MNSKIFLKVFLGLSLSSGVWSSDTSPQPEKKDPTVKLNLRAPNKEILSLKDGLYQFVTQQLVSETMRVRDIFSLTQDCLIAIEKNLSSEDVWTLWNNSSEEERSTYQTQWIILAGGKELNGKEKKWEDLFSSPFSHITLTWIDLSSLEQANNLTTLLQKNTHVRSLNLGHCKITAEGAKALAEALKENKMLTSLNLEWNRIGVEGTKALVEVLKVNQTLTSLNLWKNSIGDEGTKALAEVLKENSTLTSLNLRYNSIGAEGAKALAEALKENKTLTSLDLQRNDIGFEGNQALEEVRKVNTTFQFFY